MARPGSSVREHGASVHLARLIATSLWLGAALLFSASVAPSAFATLPTRELAGAVVGRVLPVLFWTGAGLGVMLVALEIRTQSIARRRTRLSSAAIIVVACLGAQLLIAPRIAALRANMDQPLAVLAADHPQRLAFGRLHMLSVAALGAAMLAGCAFVVATAITLDRTPPQ